MPNSGVHIAITACRLHHIPYKVIREVETKDPALILHLYKMLSHLMARRQQGTIDQISQLHSIMTSPAPTKPVSRATMAALQNAMKYH
jgi:CRP-like cAMP-binding protein